MTEEYDPAGDNVVPAIGCGPWLPVTRDEADIFNDILADEVDSWFASSICCCDICYDEFKTHWPEVAFREMEFQTQSMGTDSVVDGSRLPEVYSEAEISTLTRLVRCPRCGSDGACNLWIYEHRFSNSEELEQDIDELLTLGQRTPFLLLEHPFARRVLAAIRAMVPASGHLAAGTTFFRARAKDDVTLRGQSPDEPSTYGAPPAHAVGEGRFNHAGSPMLYLASSVEVAAAEIAKPGARCLIGELQLTAPQRVLDLVEIDEDGEHFELLKALVSSALLSAPNTGMGWLKREYVFSRFVADCARAAGFDAIRYGSNKREEGANCVLLEPHGDPSQILRFIGHQELDGLEPARRY